MSLFETDLAEDREWLRVGDAYEVTKKPRGLDRSNFQQIPFAAMDAIPQDGTYLPDFTMKAPDAIASGTYFERHDVLVGKITPSFENGKQALVRDLISPFGYATTEVIPLHRRSTQHDPRFLFYFLLHPDVRGYVAERMEGSTGRQRVQENVLLDLKMPAVPHPEQIAIADVLEKIQQASSIELKCDKTARSLKDAVMRFLFTRGLRGEMRKETEIGLVPESWDIVPFTEIVRLKRGFDLPQSERSDGRVPVYGSNGIVGFHSFAPSLAPIPGVMVGRSGSVGRVSLSDAPYWPLNTTLFAENFCGNDERFVFYFLQRFDFSVYSQGVSVPTLNRNSFAATLVAKPSLNEQLEIAALLDAIERKIDLHRRKHAVLDELFKALLHKLMTGEIRVADLDLSVLAEETAA